MKKITICLLLICFLAGCIHTTDRPSIDGTYKLVGIRASEDGPVIDPSKLGFSGSLKIIGDTGTLKLISSGSTIDEEITIKYTDDEDDDYISFIIDLKSLKFVGVYTIETSVLALAMALDNKNIMYLVFE